MNDADDATPPLVAAPPVPPVVPDSEALADQIPASMPQDGLHWYRRWLVAQQQLDAKFQREVSSGSGVVPDKPALDLSNQPGPGDRVLVNDNQHDAVWIGNGLAWCTECDEVHSGITQVSVSRRFAPFVPAVTDDEAATKALAVALHDPDECRQCMVRKAGGHCVAWNGTLLRSASIISALRSAGFLIVHHTKET